MVLAASVVGSTWHLGWKTLRSVSANHRKQYPRRVELVGRVHLSLTSCSFLYTQFISAMHTM